MNNSKAVMKKRRGGILSVAKERRKLLFYGLWMLLPLSQLAIFYFAVNINSILLAFQKYTVTDGRGAYVFAGFENFKNLFADGVGFSLNGLKTMVKNTLLGFFIPEIITFLPSIIMSYYVYKKCLFSKFFRVLLYLPTLLSVLALSIIQYYILELGVPEIAGKFGKDLDGILSNPDTALTGLIVLQIWFGFCKGIMLYPATMSSIPDSAIESARIDGCDAWGEFWHIILPLIYPTITVMFIADLAGIARVDLGTFNMYGQYTDPKLYTIGYYLYNETLKAGIADYPHLATFGVFLTLIVVPVVLLVRYLLNKFGPSED